MTAIEALREQVEGLAAIGHTPAAFVLQYGRWGEATPLPRGVKRGRMGWCYGNAGRLAGERLVYCEGYAIRDGLPVALQHGWLADVETGKFMDPTWPELGGAYVGVPFQTGYLLTTCVQTKTWGLLGHGWALPEDPAEFLATLGGPTGT